MQAWPARPRWAPRSARLRWERAPRRNKLKRWEPPPPPPRRPARVYPRSARAAATGPARARTVGRAIGTECASTTSTIAGGRTTSFDYPSAPAQTTTPAQTPGLLDMAQPNDGRVSGTIPGGQQTDFSYPTSSTLPTGQPGGIGSDIVASPDDNDDAPEPPDTPPPEDPNAPRPPGNVPGQLIGARDNYPNSHLDNPRNPFYRDSGRTDYRQGRPGVDYRTARQAGIVPNFRVGDYNVHDLDARLIENINRAIEAMECAASQHPRQSAAHIARQLAPKPQSAGWMSAHHRRAFMPAVMRRAGHIFPLALPVAPITVLAVPSTLIPRCRAAH